MKTLVLNSVLGNAPDSLPAAIKTRILREDEARGQTRAAFGLNGMDIKPCPGCFICHIKTPGTCAIRDRQQKIVRALVISDAFIAITPVTFGGYSPVLKRSTNANGASLFNSCRRCFGNSNHYFIGSIPFEWSTP